MKRNLLFITFLFFWAAVSAQFAQTKMQLSATEHDFGKFKEEAGRPDI